MKAFRDQGPLPLLAEESLVKRGLYAIYIVCLAVFIANFAYLTAHPHQTVETIISPLPQKGSEWRCVSIGATTGKSYPPKSCDFEPIWNNSEWVSADRYMAIDYM
mgnify:CR=1 FL=1